MEARGVLFARDTINHSPLMLRQQRDLHQYLRGEALASRERIAGIVRPLDPSQINEHPEATGYRYCRRQFRRGYRAHSGLLDRDRTTDQLSEPCCDHVVCPLNAPVGRCSPTSSIVTWDIPHSHREGLLVVHNGHWVAAGDVCCRGQSERHDRPLVGSACDPKRTSKYHLGP